MSSSLIRRIKKKTNNKSLTKHQKVADDEITSNDIKIIESELAKIVKRYNSDSSIRKQILKELEESYNKWDLSDYYTKSEFVKFYPFKYNDLFEKNESDLIYVICDRDQDYRVAVSDFIYDIAEELEKILNQSKEFEESVFF